MKEIKCPNCGSKAIGKGNGGTPLILLGLGLTLFIVTAIIGIPLLIMGLTINASDRKDGIHRYECKTCKYEFEIRE